MNETGSVANGVWKWIAALLATVLIAGTPAIIQTLRAPSSSDVQQIRDRQLEVLVRLATIEAQLDELERRLEAHEQDTR